MARLASIISPLPVVSRSPRSAPSTLLLAALAVLVFTAGGCRFVARGPFAGRAMPGDSAAVDSAVAGDTLIRLDTVAVDSAVAEAIRAAAVSDTAAADTLPGGERHSVEELLKMGPTYTPYDVSPKLLPGGWLTNLLSDTLAPVVDRHDHLSVRDVALFWVLVDRSGEVRDAVLHTTSDAEAFDQAARAVAERLRFRPAVADGEPVPVWVLKRISLLMR